MTQEEKQILSTDLCARLMHRVKCFVPVENCIMELTGKRLNYFCFHKEEWGYDYSHEFEVVLDPLNDSRNGYIVKPYLRPMSSMTEEEKKELTEMTITSPNLETAAVLFRERHYEEEPHWRNDWTICSLPKVLNWLNSHHFDYRGLIEKGLAIEAPKGMYDYD